MAYPYTSYQNPYNYAPQPYVPQTGIIWVSGESEASMYPIAPNNAVALWEKSGKVVYLKSADATGKPTIRTYDLVERTNLPSEDVLHSEVKLPTYATKDDLTAVLSVVNGFDELLGSLRSDIDAIKGDMYGIAGKKKAKKTIEVDEDE